MKQLNSYIVGLNYKVFVHCNTFNQSAYIKDALNGFVIQQTNFPYVCMVMDDCSTDGEQQLLIDWMTQECDMNNAKEFDIPDSRVIIVPHKKNESCTFAFYLLKRNTWKEIDTRKTMYNIWRSRSTYIALCEGDDYWTDPLKLKKQYDYMEKHPECPLCFHKATVFSNLESEISMFDHLENRDYSASEIFNRWTVPTCSAFFRTQTYRDYYKFNKNVLFGDIYLWITLSQAGTIHCLGFNGAVYRRNENGLSFGSMPLNRRIQLIEQYRMMSKRFPFIKKEAQKAEELHLGGVIYEPYFPGQWKYRFRYMTYHPRLFFSGFMTTTLLSYTFLRNRKKIFHG